MSILRINRVEGEESQGRFFTFFCCIGKIEDFAYTTKTLRREAHSHERKVAPQLVLGAECFAFAKHFSYIGKIEDFAYTKMLREDAHSRVRKKVQTM